MNEANAVERPVMPNLLHGDCLDLMDAIPDGSIDMVMKSVAIDEAPIGINYSFIHVV